MTKIECYKKKEKKYYRVKNLYLGRNELTGKKCYRDKSGFKSTKEAQRWIGKMLEDISKNGVSGRQMKVETFTELYDLFLEHQRRNTKPSTVAITRRYIEIHVQPYIGDMQLSDIKPIFLQKLVYHWHDKYKQYAYIRKMVSQVFKYGVSLEIIDTNPMAKTLLPRPKPSEKKLQFWTKQEVKIFFESLEDFGNVKQLTYFRLLVYTGMRKSEGLALQWKDIDFKNRKISISKTIGMDENQHQYVSDTPKTVNSIRTISIDLETLDQLQVWRSTQREEYFKLGFNTTNEDQFIFTDMKNVIYKPQTVNDWLNYLIKKYELPRITPHNLRHTHVSLLLEAGVPIKEVSERVGHKDSKITMEIYAHISEDQEEKAINTFIDFMKAN